MLNNIAQYYYYKFKYVFDKSINKRYPLRSEFKIFLVNRFIQETKKELIDYAENRLQIENIDVMMIHSYVNWDNFYVNLTTKEKRMFNNWHMKVVLKADLKYPIIVTTNKEGQITNILDGLHRIKKAFMLKKSTILAYKIPENDLLTLKG